MLNFLSQCDLAEGWNISMKRKKYKNQLETNIYLSNLPPHLFHKFDETYMIINDRGLKYNIIKTKHDTKVFELYNELNKNIINIIKIKELYNYCKSNNINGWLIINVEKLINLT